MLVMTHASLGFWVSAAKHLAVSVLMKHCFPCAGFPSYCQFPKKQTNKKRAAERHVLWLIQNTCLFIIQQPQGQAE